MIGAKGKAIAKVMDQFNVVVRFPRDKQTNTVTISGMEENVEDAKDHLLMLADDYVSIPFSMQLTLIGKGNSATTHPPCCVFIASPFFYASLAVCHSFVHREVGFGSKTMFRCFDGTLMFLPFVLIATLGFLYQTPAKLLICWERQS